MNSAVFAEWLRRQGYIVYKTPSTYWYNAAPHVLQAFPYHLLISPDKKEIESLMYRHKILALRYSTASDNAKGKLSYHILQEGNYNLDTLRSQARNGVRRGLENFRIEKISFDRMASEGWKLQESTLARQNRLKSMTVSEWRLLCKSAGDLPGFDCFGALIGNVLAAALIVCRVDSIYMVPFALSSNEYLSRHVNNALFFSAVCEMLREEGISGVFFTVQSLDAPEDVDEFKIRMGFGSKIVRQVVEFHPLISPLINSAVHRVSKSMARKFPANPSLAKIEGMLRFYLEGSQPVAKQSLPRCLRTMISENGKELQIA
jgi:hypothetical protein